MYLQAHSAKGPNCREKSSIASTENEHTPFGLKCHGLRVNGAAFCDAAVRARKVFRLTNRNNSDSCPGLRSSTLLVSTQCLSCRR